MTAFWACRRFSASSQMTLGGPSRTSAVISLPRYAGRQCSTIASGRRAWRRAPASSWYGARIGQTRRRLVLLAHRDPGVGDDDVGARDRGDRVALEDRPSRRWWRRWPRRASTISGVRLVPLGPADHDVHPGGRAGQQPGVAHVAGAVAEEDDVSPASSPLCSRIGEQVGQQLAGVEVVGERVDHRDAGVRPPSPRGWPGRRCATRSAGLAAQDPGHVGDRLAHADAGQRAVDQHRVAPELGDAGRERRLGAQGRLVEDHRDGDRAGERLCVVRRRP